MFVSVAICTWNRAESLRKTLDSLRTVTVPQGVGWEILVVNNNCDDHTEAVVESFDSELPIRSAVEMAQGLSNGRNCAIVNTTGDLLIFIDDDIRVEPKWLEAYITAARQYPLTGYFGGPINPVYDFGKPAWIKDESLSLVSGVLGWYRPAASSGPYPNTNNHPFGANMCFRRSTLETVGMFSTRLGMSGATPGRGEETDYFVRAANASISGYYIVDAACGHAVQQSHLTLSHLYKLGFQKGRAGALMHGERKQASSLAQLSLITRGLWQFFKGRPDRFRQSLIAIGIERGNSAP